MQRDRLEGYLAQLLCLGLAVGSKYKSGLRCLHKGGWEGLLLRSRVRARAGGGLGALGVQFYQPHTQGLFAFSSETSLLPIY